jgi:hypothetical protein
LKALSEEPFSLVRELAKAACFSVSTVYTDLTKPLGFVLRHLSCVPHLLTDEEKRRRAEISKQLLALLEESRKNPAARVVTLDESWLYLFYEREAIWLQPTQDPPERVKHTIQDEKVMITIATTFFGFYILDALPKGQHFNGEYYKTQILEKILDPEIWRGQRTIIIHADNAKVHWAKKCQPVLKQSWVKRATHPPDSRDLAPCDFFLFGYIKDRFKGQQFRDQEVLEARVLEIMAGITPEIWDSVFGEWLVSLRWVIKHEGDYYRKGK